MGRAKVMREAIFNGIAYRANNVDNARVTLILIHGLSGSLSVWLPYEKHFMHEFNMVTMDLRGHGLSWRPHEFDQYNPQYSAEDIINLLLALEVKKAVIVAHSFGALVALELLKVQFPGFLGVVLISPLYGIANRRFFSILEIGSRLGGGLLPSWRGNVKGGRTDYKKYVPSADWDAYRIYEDLCHTGLRSFFYTLQHACLDRDGEWPAVPIKTHIVHGLADSFVPVEAAHALKSSLPDSHLRIIAGGNHILPVNNILEIAMDIRQFAQGLIT